jgi:hypothetical protein
VDGKVGQTVIFSDSMTQIFRKSESQVIIRASEAGDLRDHVTTGWDSVIENNSLLLAIREQVQPILIAAKEGTAERSMPKRGSTGQ